MLLEALRDSRRKDIQFDLSVESILYRDGKKKAGEPDQAFLYLADILCTIYQEVIANSASCGVAMQSACLYFKPLGAGRCHFWTYHKRDNRYRELYRAYTDGDVFAALLGICQLRTQNEALPYDTLWLKDIENELVARPLDEVSVNRFFAYVNGNTFEPALAMNILKVFQRQREHTVQSNATESMLCRLSQIEMTLYNHTGRVADAEKAYHEAMQRARYCPVETYMELSNRMAVMLCDALQFDKALEISRHTLRCAESVSEIKRKLYPSSSDSNLLLGRTYSQIGQCLAFMRRYGEASDYFRKAMEAFGVNHGEIAITRTYLLHTLIEAGDEQAYDELCRMALGCELPEEQLRVLAEMQDPVPQKFALYWYLKGLYFFKRKRLTAEFAKRLTETVQALYQVNKAGQHPWEMNLKYTALLGYSLLPKESQKMATLISNQWFGTIQETEGSILCRIHNEGDRQLKLAAQGGDDVFAGSSLTFMYR